MAVEDSSSPVGVSLREAARRLGVGSVQTIQRWLENGKLRGEKRVKPNGQEQWLVYLPEDETELEALRRTLRRPTAPADAVFPGPPHDSALLERQWKVIEFLMAELAAKRSEVKVKDHQDDSLSALMRRLESQLAAPSCLSDFHRLQISQILSVLQQIARRGMDSE